MFNPYIGINFSFTKETCEFLDSMMPVYLKEFYKNFPETGGFFRPKLIDTPFAKEIKDFLNQLNITDIKTEILIHKDIGYSKLRIENLHIDAPRGIPLPCRFNIMYRGDGLSNLHLWNVDCRDKKITQVSVPMGGSRYQIVGNNVTEKIENIKHARRVKIDKEFLSKTNKTADFLRTEFVHAVEKTGSERILISTCIHHSWDYVYEQVINYKSSL
tara:strand:- start:182 stop:826 length:645 start_codon:yes stop_codon:yes gene_type:complete